MKTLTDELAQYGAYHRDRRNLVTHFIGIPLIVVAVAILLSRPSLPLAGIALSPAVVVTIAALIFYLKLDLRFGLTMAVLMGLSLWTGAWFAAQPTNVWLTGGIGLFVVGWVFQFVGHYYEGRKPAFVDDVIGLIIGPLFVVAEAGFLLGCREEVRREIEARIGPTHIRSTRAPTA